MAPQSFRHLQAPFVTATAAVLPGGWDVGKQRKEKTTQYIPHSL